MQVSCSGSNVGGVDLLLLLLLWLQETWIQIVLALEYNMAMLNFAKSLPPLNRHRKINAAASSKKVIHYFQLCSVFLALLNCVASFNFLVRKFFMHCTIVGLCVVGNGH